MRVKTIVAAALLAGMAFLSPLSKGAALMRLRARSRVASATGTTGPVERTLEWDPRQTAVIVCDMWDMHYCRAAERRIDEMVPRMNRMLEAARRRGITVIHAPSGTMGFYAERAERLRMTAAWTAEPPAPIGGWRDLDPAREGTWPIDDAELPCDDPTIDSSPRPATREHPGIQMCDGDGVSDSAGEIYGFCRAKGISNLAYVGVHTNRCVIGRPFGIRQMVDLGMNVVLVRDLTDAVYDPRKWPFVSHERGTELVVEHIERYWCPSILAEELER